ncbi:MAG: hypothetical protein H6P98_2389 [Candidatus Aminicenantes bacterium]|nr:hypothetical protein [Candidatus Aminicenantes bacterium]
MNAFSSRAFSLQTRAFYPWLFALFPAAFLYSHNIGETPARSLWLPLVLSLGLALLVWLAARAAAPQGGKASLITLLFCIMFFTYGHIGLGLKFPSWMVFPWAAVFLLVSGLVLSARRDFSGWASGLNTFAAFLIISVGAQIAWARMHSSGNPPRLTQLYQDARLSAAKPDLENFPDVYYLIVDRYANGKVLKEEFGFDNREFLDFLRAKGFYVADESRCNYPQTHMSLASSLNMDYIDRARGERSVGPSFIYRILKDSRVLRLFKSLGYTFIQLGSWFEGTAFNPYADLNLEGSGVLRFSNDFFFKFIRTTALCPLTVARLYGPRQRLRILQQLDELERMPSRKSPKFVFAHLLITHMPYVFGPNGEESDVRDPEKSFTYIDQVCYANTRLSRLIDILISGSSHPPIIVLQSDEGPKPGRPAVLVKGKRRKPTRSARTETEAQNRVHHPILNAMAFPGVDTKVLYPSISPVNTFRVLFNLYFRARYALLPDRTCDPSKNADFGDLIESDE